MTAAMPQTNISTIPVAITHPATDHGHTGAWIWGLSRSMRRANSHAPKGGGKKP